MRQSFSTNQINDLVSAEDDDPSQENGSEGEIKLGKDCKFSILFKYQAEFFKT